LNGGPGGVDIWRDVTYSDLMIRDDVKALVAGKNFATISTLLPSGHIQSHVVWVDCDDDHIVINTEIGLRKFKNVQADPRVTVTIWDRKNPYFFAEVRGRVVQTVTGPEARANIDSLAQKYLDADYPEEWIHSERVILKIAPNSQIVFASGIHDIRR
jgi:PPOX class probable F420-dependent enzyme